MQHLSKKSVTARHVSEQLKVIANKLTDLQAHSHAMTQGNMFNSYQSIVKDVEDARNTILEVIGEKLR